MAKRKRLTPAQPGYLAPDSPAPAADPARAPIARVAGDASASAALSELSDTLRSARAEGRMIDVLALDCIDETHLVRDRMAPGDDDDMAALMASLESRGQQTPIEVVALPAPRNGKTHGLISGARRLSALRRLRARSEDPRFATVQARLIAPADAQAAYVAMVEENEIRAGLSLYEKGRITLRAVHEGVYPTPRAALRGLFGSVSRSRRSKIGSFLELVEPLDAVLRFPAMIPEKLGLGLAKALQADHAFASALRLKLRSDPAATADEELAVLNAALRDWTHEQAAGGEGAGSDPTDAVDRAAPSGAPGPRPRITGPDPESVARRLEASRVTARFDAAAGRITLTGGGVDAALFAAIQGWLKSPRS